MKTLRLRVPSPASPERLDRFLAANVPDLGRRAARGVIEAGGVDVDQRSQRGSGLRLRPGQWITLRYHPGRLPAAELDPEPVLAEGPGWIAIRKPPGLPSHRAEDDALGVPERLAECLGGAATEFRPVHRLDRWTSGVLLVATEDGAASALSRAFADRAVTKDYLAVVCPAPREQEGRQEEPGMTLSWRVLRRSADGRRAELLVRPEQGRTHQIRRQLAAAGLPILGDPEHGRCVPGGAPRMALHCVGLVAEGVDVSCPPPPGWDGLLEPTVRKAPQSSAPSGLRTLRVSGATARVLRGGHPWVLRDAGTGPLEGWSAGDLAQLVDPRGAPAGVALVDPGAPLCARVVGGSAPVRWGQRARAALRRRQTLLDDPRTTALRLLHGEADGVPGLVIDLWGDVLVATVACEAARAVAPAIYEVLLSALGPRALIEQDHLTDLRRDGPPRDAALPSRVVFGAAPPGRVEVLEDGLRYGTEPLAGLTTGLYTDQRTNRRRCSERGAGAVVANLFSHTGAFTVALAAAGAERVFSVDLGQRYLAWGEENLRRNGLDPARHPSVEADAVGWLLSGGEPLDGAILDPPSHARGKGRRDRDWNARRDYATLVQAAAARLRPGGWLLCCVNCKGVRRSWLPDKVRQGVEGAGRRLAKTEPAGPAADHPRKKGFPEGLAFVGLLATVE